MSRCWARARTAIEAWLCEHRRAGSWCWAGRARPPASLDRQLRQLLLHLLLLRRCRAGGLGELQHRAAGRTQAGSDPAASLSMRLAHVSAAGACLHQLSPAAPCPI